MRAFDRLLLAAAALAILSAAGCRERSGPRQNSGQPGANQGFTAGRISAEARRGVDPSIELLLDFDRMDMVNCALHPEGGYLVCRDGITTIGSVARLDESGRELWRSEFQGTDHVEVLKVDDSGSIYVFSRDGVLQVLDPRGQLLWEREKLFTVFDPIQIGDSHNPSLLRDREGMGLVDHTGQEFYRLDKAETDAQMLRGYFRRNDDGSCLLMLGRHVVSGPPEAEQCGYDYELLDGTAQVLWRYHEAGPAPEEWEIGEPRNHYGHRPGEPAILPDGRAILHTGEDFVEFDDSGQPHPLDCPGTDPINLFDSARYDSDTTPEGNFLFLLGNDTDILGEGLRLLELSPRLELLHSHYYDLGSLTPEPLANPDPERVNAPHNGHVFYDKYTRLVYMYREDEYGARRGAVYVLGIDGSQLAVWRTGEGDIRHFLRREDGRIIVQRSGGDLLLLPEMQKGGETAAAGSPAPADS